MSVDGAAVFVCTTKINKSSRNPGLAPDGFCMFLPFLSHIWASPAHVDLDLYVATNPPESARVSIACERWVRGGVILGSTRLKHTQQSNLEAV